MPGKRKIGRPLKGRSEDGEPVAVSRFPRLTVIMEQPVKDRLEALSSITSKPAYQIIREALEAHLSALPLEDRRLVEAQAKRMQEHRAAKSS
jgi:predicted DNA-binding protein